MLCTFYTLFDKFFLKDTKIVKRGVKFFYLIVQQTLCTLCTQQVISDEVIVFWRALARLTDKKIQP